MYAEPTRNTPEETRAQHQRDPVDPPRLHVVWEFDEIHEVQQMIDRAWGTLEPKLWPAWARDFEKVVAGFKAK